MDALGSGTDNVVREWLWNAIDRVHADQPSLWEWGVGERARVGQIYRALYETEPFHGRWDIDLEWNRESFDGDPKRQGMNRSGYGTPDLAVHHRGKDGPEHNLLIVEFKNALNQGRNSYRDRRKIEWWMGAYSYCFGAVIALGPSLREFRPVGIWLTSDGSGKPEKQSWP
ncbi:hypothetical protein [Arthrobacter sp. MDT1-65]